MDIVTKIEKCKVNNSKPVEDVTIVDSGEIAVPAEGIHMEL